MWSRCSSTGRGRKVIQVLVSYLTRTAGGEAAHRDSVVSGAKIRIGRASDCEIQLPDPRVPLHHSDIRPRGGGAAIEVAQANYELEINGEAMGSGDLNPGDSAMVGPFEICSKEASGGVDLHVTVEQVRAIGDDLPALKARSRTEFDTLLFDKRKWSWLLSIAALVFVVILPLMAALPRMQGSPPPDFPLDTAGLEQLGGEVGAAAAAKGWLATADSIWISGGLSGAHRFFVEDCSFCHQKPFEQVTDGACLHCHKTIEVHADPVSFAATHATFEATACQRCHKEHNGVEAIVLDEQAFCTDCHAGLKSTEASTKLLDVSDFGSNHPEFRPTVITRGQSREEPSIVRVALGDITVGQNRPLSNPLDAYAGCDPEGDDGGVVAECSNLKFPHDKHLVAKGVRHPQKDNIVLGCGDCHQPEKGGVGMAPIDMETNCHDCHKLTFEAAAPNRLLPHGKPREAVEQMREFYARIALTGGLNDPKAPEVVQTRRLPGQSLSEEESRISLLWAEQKAKQVTEETIGKRACGSCHFVTPPAADSTDGFWDIAKPRLADRWMPKGLFDHGQHEAAGSCQLCHQAETSKTSEDILLPGIQICRDCHSGEDAQAEVPSTCISCHLFHQPGASPMRNPHQGAEAVGEGNANGGADG